MDVGVESNGQSEILRWKQILRDVSENSSGLNTDPEDTNWKGRERSTKIQRRKSPGGTKMISRFQKSKNGAP